MNIAYKKFRELTSLELFTIFKARQDVFIIEQECIYPDIDETDLISVHALLEENDRLLAYLRMFPKEKELGTVQIGRVLSLERRQGYGQRLLHDALQYAKLHMNAERFYLEAQCYAVSLYEKEGFEITSEPFLEDGIPHVQMRKK